MEEGEVKGELHARRQDVLDAIEARFGTVPANLAARLEHITDPERLRQVHRAAVTQPSLEQFLATF